ncbi:hypothetical protein RND71_033541 [Anisodus tanguticus]|uniref:Large ribosomal subunit protein uL2 RNA-binding domain-containing protein n=1 Tax=Anisodus tanguticus TaxID=243964 RepID=A0AAE1RAE4_9SOLA|nr:hypothetical protein RND71_033541 [Anisodus tanguticus]
MVETGESLIKKQILERFFVDLVAGESLIKERATANKSFNGKSAGRNSSRRITVFHRGGESKQLQQRIDLKRRSATLKNLVVIFLTKRVRRLSSSTKPQNILKHSSSLRNNKTSPRGFDCSKRLLGSNDASVRCPEKEQRRVSLLDSSWPLPNEDPHPHSLHSHASEFLNK